LIAPDGRAFEAEIDSVRLEGDLREELKGHVTDALAAACDDDRATRLWGAVLLVLGLGLGLGTGGNLGK
jgi:hypothetical protein